MYTILSFNIANAMNDEKTDFRLGLRLSKICDLIRKENPDVVLLQEIRFCRNEEDTLILTPQDVAYLIATQTNLSIAGLFMLNPTPESFGRLTLYNPKTVFPLRCFGEWCWDNYDRVGPSQYGTAIQYTKFVSVNKDYSINYDDIFWTANIHYPLPSEAKMKVNQYLKKRISEIVGNERIYILGDFNTFVRIQIGDLIEEGNYEEQMKDLKSTFLELSSKIKETYYTFPHDPLVRKFNQMINSNLDHVFKYPCIYDDDNEICTVISTKENRESDHYMIKLSIN